MKPIFYWSETEDKQVYKDEAVEILDYNLIHREGEVAYVVIQVISSHMKFSYKWLEIFYEPEGLPDNLKDNSQPFHFFKGRLSSLPEYVKEGVIRLIFSAIPHNITEQIDLLSHTLKKSIFWNSLFFEKEPAPKDLLEGQTEIFYFDRVNHTLSLSNLFLGKKTDVVDNSILQKSFFLKINEIPLAYIDICIQAEWVQQAQGSFNLFPLMARQFTQGTINTFTPQSLEKTWPETGQLLGRSGYSILSSQLKKIIPSSTGILNLYPTVSGPLQIKKEGKNTTLKRLRRHWYKGHLEVGWSYRQKREESVVFRVHHCHQLKHQAPLKNKKLTFKLQAITPEDSHQDKRAVFFETDRGYKVINQGIQIAKAHLASKSRCVVAQFKVPLAVGVLWCPDMCLTVKHDFIPGGQATGKIIELKVCHSHQIAFCQVKVGFSIGEKKIFDEQREKMPLYVEADYHETEENQDFFLNLKAENPVEGLENLHQKVGCDFIKEIQIKNQGSQQARFLYTNQYPNYNDIIHELTYRPTEIQIRLKSLKTKGSLKRNYSLEQNLQFYPPQQVILT